MWCLLTYLNVLNSLKSGRMHGMRIKVKWSSKELANIVCEFRGKLKLVAERKVGAAEAERFCKAFQRIHKRLVCTICFSRNNSRKYEFSFCLRC
ncbi:hypothetical protein C1H46_023834 [Malus baccata]|uniref:Uncharacterized protein n=1 Tax=Malus baccata TaxID=106549 RepID=A0A540LVQ7_MALBA|nr:hypothetical protein C1H46_023834 [Malus baccata]